MSKDVKKDICKIIFLGESGVGKTCVINRFVNDKFSADQEMSMGAGFSSKDIKISDKEPEVSLDIWDTAG